MSLIPTVYRSTDPGAPVLSGTPGSFAALMDAVLVTGYGTGPDAKPGLGWTRAFSDGHKRAYQNNLAAGGTGMFWRIDDSNAQYALSSGYHSMSSVDEGVDGFSMSGNSLGKSITANTVARNWVVVGNSRTLYVFIQNGAALNGTAYVGYVAGDYECFNKGYGFNFCVGTSGNASVTTGAGRSNLLSAGNGAGDANYGKTTAARSFDGAVVGSDFVPRAPLIVGGTYHGGTQGYDYPYPATGGMLISRVVVNNGGYLFGMFPGLWSPQHRGILTRFTTYSGFNGLGDGVFIAVESVSNNALCQGLLRIDTEWEY